ncbi:MULTISPECIES: aldehyde dehydrogenase family protein [unclassified Microbacterium]|uniref:aldehyde dehydrogenase family protein n=1 Tax=unclassified Microbacterium TaxID=2609290 RepID=UPI0015E394B7|nr:MULTISPECIES: aldehyde dehydrogenase family protein [unclassified Microbacterium]
MTYSYHANAAEVLKNARADIMQILGPIATRSSIDAEFAGSLRVLAHAESEEVWVSRIPAGQELSVFLPSNNLLYSYLLYAVMPAAWAQRIRVRPSSRVKATCLALHDLLGAHLSPSIVMADESQRAFVSEASTSNSVIFTGSPENGRNIAALLPDTSLFMGFGSGPNPVVIGREADIDRAVTETVSARLYNSGQDCLCPDVVFAHADVVDRVEEVLIEQLKVIPQGDRLAKGLVNAPLVYNDAADAARGWIRSRRDHLRWQSAEVDAPGFVPLTVVREDEVANAIVSEHFAPVFHLVRYESPAEVLRWAESPQNRENGFYISVYGEDALRDPVIGNAVNVGAVSALNQEDGNRPFGGYGRRASWVRWRGKERGTPLLTSRESALHLGNG